MKFSIQFEAGSGIHFDGGVNYLKAVGVKSTIYAECAVPEGASEDYGYLTMKKAIIARISAADGDAENFFFWYDGQEQHLAEDAAADCDVYVDIEFDDDDLPLIADPADAFPDEVPQNWEEIIAYINDKIRAGGDPSTVWENYWADEYPDAPKAIMEQEKKPRFYLYSVTVELKDRPTSAWDVIDCPEESRNLITVFDDADEAAEALRQKQPEIRIDEFPGYYRCTALMVVEYLETVENGEVADREDMGLSEFSQMPKDGGQ